MIKILTQLIDNKVIRLWIGGYCFSTKVVSPANLLLTLVEIDISHTQTLLPYSHVIGY